MAERTNAERPWQSARSEEQQGRREGGEPFRTESQRNREGYRESGYGGYQQGGYEQIGRMYGGGWPAAGPSDYGESSYYGQTERGVYNRPPGYRYRGMLYGASGGYTPEAEATDWANRPGGEFRPGSFGPRAGEVPGQRASPWGSQWPGGEGGGFTAERGSYGGGPWRTEGSWEQDRDYGDEGSWGGGTGFRGGYGGSYGGQARGGSGFTRWQGGEGSWRGGGAPGYPGGWSRGPEWGRQGQPGSSYGDEPGYGHYGYGMRGGWGGQPEWEGSGWGGRPRDWGEPGRGMADPWSIPGPFTGLGPEGYQRSGDSIRDDVCERLTRHGFIDASGIRVRIENDNEVVLEGMVPDRRTKRLAEDVADSVSGVRDVQNRLRVSDRGEWRYASGFRGEERDQREGREEGQTAHGSAAPSGGRGEPGDESRGGRPERDAERQKASPRSKN